MEIKVKYRGKEIKLKINKEKVRAIDILNELKLSPEYAFVAKNGEIISEDEDIFPEDEVKVVNAISGG